MAVCETYDPNCYGCQLRAKNVGLSAEAIPNRQNKVPPRQVSDPSWEKGRAGETRNDGSFMPYLDSVGQPMGVKELSSKRNVVETTRREQINSTQPLS